MYTVGSIPRIRSYNDEKKVSLDKGRASLFSFLVVLMKLMRYKWTLWDRNDIGELCPGRYILYLRGMYVDKDLFYMK